MTAIFGICGFDGEFVSDEQLGQMAAKLRHRGEFVAITAPARCRFGTVSRADGQTSLADYEGLSLVGSLRLDNRAELASKLEISPSDASRLSDAELLVRFWRKKGAAAPAELVGDFAFAVWDQTRCEIFLVRDQFGVRPLNFSGRRGRFVFSSEPGAVIAGAEISPRLDEEMMAAYLAGDLSDTSRSFFENVKRLSPGHLATVRNGDVSLSKYYDLGSVTAAPDASDAEYAGELRRIFCEAVASRRQNSVKCGTFLSGGLDSSAITVVAAQQVATAGEGPLPAFSLIYDAVPECDERSYIRQSLAAAPISSIFAAGDEGTPFDRLDELAGICGKPLIGVGQPASVSIFEMIRNSGVDVMLDGHDGDNAVSYGYGLLDELAAAHRWTELYREARGVAPVFEMSASKIFRAYWNQYRWKPWRKKYPALGVLRRVAAKLKASPSGDTHSAEQSADMTKLLNPDFVARTGFSEKSAAASKLARQRSRGTRADHVAGVTAGGQAYALEENEALAASYGIEMRYPFWDRRLIEFCVSLPGRMKLRNGLNRYVMRLAMEGLLPDDVRLRKLKTEFTPVLRHGMVNFFDRGGDIFFANKMDERIFNENSVRRLVTAVAATPQTSTATDLRLLWELAAAHAWQTNFSGSHKQKRDWR